MVYVGNINSHSFTKKKKYIYLNMYNPEKKRSKKRNLADIIRVKKLDEKKIYFFCGQ